MLLNKIGILSLGCPRNLVDAENILGRLSRKGYNITDINKADTAIINTCAFIESAKKESIDAILDLIDLKKEGRLKKIVVCGCLSERYKDELRKDLPEVDAFVGRVSLNHNLNRFPLTPKHYAYLKICEGCINNCSFCVIPRIKGRFTSLGAEAIIKKVKGFNKDKAAEINIIGQDTSSFGVDLYGRPKLTGLLKKILRASRDIGWIRLLYLHPGRIYSELLELIRDSSSICKYIDVPIQHINDRILKLMNRKIRKMEILKLLEKIRKTIPDVALRTSVIVGFPSETDREFRELLKFMEDVKFERLGAFIYSREENTPAFNFKKQVSQKIKDERFNALMSVQQKISGEVNKKFLGRTVKVLIDEKTKDGCLGRTQYDAPEVDGLVHIRGADNNLKAGDFITAKIIDTLEYDLVGEAEK